MINKQRLIKLTRALIRLNSENPPGDEAKVGAFVRNYLESLGLAVKIYAFANNRPNIIATLKGGNSSRSLLLTPHLDTVPAGKNWTLPPFEARLVKGRIYGLGATDCKGNLACALEALKSIVEDKVMLGYDLVFAATADEESGSSLGLIPLLERRILRPSAALVLDADDFEIVVTQKGLLHLKVRLKGKRSHAAYPWLGINAIELAAQVINELKRRKEKHLRNKYLHPPTVNVGTIRGGDKVNVVADWCDFELDFRFLPGQSHEEILNSLKKIIRKYAAEFKIEIQSAQSPYYIDPQCSLANALISAMRQVKVKPRISGSEGATVITFFQHKNIPAIATGFGVEGNAHTADEYAEINSLYKGAQVLEKFLKKYS